jgi:hypothetical protein
MTDPSPIHLLSDPPLAEVAVPVTVTPRPLTTDEQREVQALRLPFHRARQVVARMLPHGGGASRRSSFCARRRMRLSPCWRRR